MHARKRSKHWKHDGGGCGGCGDGGGDLMLSRAQTPSWAVAMLAHMQIKST